VKLAKRRYLAVEVDSIEAFGSRQTMDAVWSAVTRLFGEYGASQTGLNLIDYDEKKKIAIIRTWHKTLEMVRAALASITQMENKPVAMHILVVSGTIKGLHGRLEEHSI
jgi:ribonuclease P/MRP protein subunit POP5